MIFIDRYWVVVNYSIVLSNIFSFIYIVIREIINTEKNIGISTHSKKLKNIVIRYMSSKIFFTLLLLGIFSYQFSLWDWLFSLKRGIFGYFFIIWEDVCVMSVMCSFIYFQRYFLYFTVCVLCYCLVLFVFSIHL